MLVLDFLVPVLQSSNSSDLNTFFQVLFSLLRTVCNGSVNLLLSESLRSTVFFPQVRESFFCFFFSLKLQTVSPLNALFRKIFAPYTFSVILTL